VSGGQVDGLPAGAGGAARRSAERAEIAGDGLEAHEIDVLRAEIEQVRLVRTARPVADRLAAGDGGGERT